MKRDGKPSREVISFTVALFIFAYLASMTMFDAASKFKLCILVPAFVGLFILLIYTAGNGSLLPSSWLGRNVKEDISQTRKRWVFSSYPALTGSRKQALTPKTIRIIMR